MTNGDGNDLLLAQYEFARDNRGHADTSAWEMTSIVWGAQTLLLGFVLEAISNTDAQPLIIGVGVLGILLCIFNFRVMQARNRVCNAMIRICLRIEIRLRMVLKPQHFLNRFYRRGIQRRWFYIVNTSFALAWLAVIVKACVLYFHPYTKFGTVHFFIP
jgi:hypothetical protein